MEVCCADVNRLTLVHGHVQYRDLLLTVLKFRVLRAERFLG
jgi:hypothetical protein